MMKDNSQTYKKQKGTLHSCLVYEKQMYVMKQKVKANIKNNGQQKVRNI